MDSLTSHLLLLDNEAHRKATSAPFLSHAGRGTLPVKTLSAWLAQDRLYALTYTRFISVLLSQLPISTATNRASTLQWRVTSCLIDCLVNIKREVGMFEDIAANEKWAGAGHSDGKGFFDEVRMNEATRRYEALFASCSWAGGVGLNAGGGPLGIWRGMILLWATEQCYFDAWSHARREMEESGVDAKGAEVQADVVRRELIPNWSSDEFAEFVNVLKKLVDEMGMSASREDIMEAEDVWRHVLEVEAKFWPEL